MTGASGAFTLPQRTRESLLLPRLIELTAYHRANCAGYARVLAALGYDPLPAFESITELPWLLVRLFKEHQLSSIPDASVLQILHSSGTTTGAPSRIYLDRHAAKETQRTLAHTMQMVIGHRRLPMLVIDSAAVLARRPSMSARGAGVLGMMAYGRDHTFLLDSAGKPASHEIRRFMLSHARGPFLIFGFTFMVWQHLLPAAQRESLDLSKGLLLHSGGWKKLTERKVSNAEFRRRLGEFGLRRIHNFYGMVEQIGTVFLEATRSGELYCPDIADVIIRDATTWAEAPVGAAGSSR
jgi:Acyl-protein synthetase, LuxE